MGFFVRVTSLGQLHFTRYLLSTMKDLPRFYKADAQIQDTYPLPDDEARHAKVLRLTDSEHVHVVDGKGKLFLGEIQAIKRGFEIKITALELEEQASEANFTLAVAPTKNMSRFEWVIEKAVEVGVSEIIPTKCENSERVHLKKDRLEKIAISAMKQSKALWKANIHELTEFSKVLDIDKDKKWIAHCHNGSKSSLTALINTNQSQLVCIGPEGDFSEDEVSKSIEFGFEALSLGNQRLRTETAAITVCIAANLFRP